MLGQDAVQAVSLVGLSNTVRGKRGIDGLWMVQVTGPLEFRFVNMLV